MRRTAAVALLLAVGCASSETGAPESTTDNGGSARSSFIVGGYVVGATVEVTVALSGAASRTTRSNALGYYSFIDLPNGTYTITPSDAGYTFAPSSATVNVNGADVRQDFTAATTATPPVTHAISGTVSGAVATGVTVTLTGAASAATTTDPSGHYSFGGLADGSYTVTPSMAGFTFTPPGATVVVNGASATQDFTAATAPPVTHTISGTVSGAVSAWVTVTLTGAASVTTTAGPQGTYAIGGLADGTYTVTPIRAGYTFSPTSADVVLAGADATRDFTAALIPVPPSAPWNPVAHALSATEIELSWFDTSTNESGFEVQRSLDGTTWTVLASLPANTTRHVDGPLVPVTRYHYRVRATGAAGPSPFGGPVSAATPPTIPLPRSGQTQSYHLLDDAYMGSGMPWPSPRFTSHDGGHCMVDNLTGLMWPSNANLPGGTMTWPDALGFVSGTMNIAWQYCGYTDWRLPNVVELESLENLGSTTWLAASGFTNVGDFHSSTTWTPSGSAGAYAVAVSVPGAFTYALDGLIPLNVFPVRGTSSVLPRTGRTRVAYPGDDGSVRAGVAWPSPRFSSFDGGSCIVDHLTGLMWTADGDLPRGAVTWDAAFEFVAGTMNGTWRYCGFTDWRLPNLVELGSLRNWDLGTRAAYLDGQGFAVSPTGSYWSSSTVSTDPLVGVLLGIGMQWHLAPTSTAFVHPVRTHAP